MPLQTAFSPDVATAIGAGDRPALLVGLVCMAAHWMELGGSDIRWRNSTGMANCVVGGTPEQRALLAAGCDLYDLLMLAPESREALLHFLDQLVLEHAKGE